MVRGAAGFPFEWGSACILKFSHNHLWLLPAQCVMDSAQMRTEHQKAVFALFTNPEQGYSLYVSWRSEGSEKFKILSFLKQVCEWRCS